MTDPIRWTTDQQMIVPIAWLDETRRCLEVRYAVEGDEVAAPCPGDGNGPCEHPDGDVHADCGGEGVIRVRLTDDPADLMGDVPRSLRWGGLWGYVGERV